jgi:hypothetical protein
VRRWRVFDWFRLPPILRRRSSCLSLAGCGAEDEGLSRAQFAREANSMCGRGNETVRKLGPEPPILTGKQADWILKLTRIDRATLSDLRALEPPQEQGPTIASMLAMFERGLARGRSDRAGVPGGKRPGLPPERRRRPGIL